MAGIDTNRTTAGASDLLPKQISSEIWSNAIEESVIMQAARQVPLPGSGITVPIITGDAEAGWVNETDEKPVSQATLGSKSITPYKLAVIELFSTEFLRDMRDVYAELARRLPKALGTKFDATVLNGTAPGSNFDVLTNSTAVTVDATDTIGDLANVLTTVGATGADVTKWLISPQAEGRIMTAKDGQGQYAFLRDARTDSGSIGSIFGRDVLKSKAVYAAGTPNVIGFAGDFANSALWGSVEGIKVDITDTATVNQGGTQVNLWQRNMVAIRAEVEVGFAVKNAAHFVKLTDGATGGGEG